MRKIQLVALLLVTTSFMLTACGQKGPLFLTEEQVAQAQEAAPAADTEDTVEEKAEEMAEEQKVKSE